MPRKTFIVTTGDVDFWGQDVGPSTIEECLNDSGWFNVGPIEVTEA